MSDRIVPRATYRLQFRKEFGFRDAEAIAPYLARLGVSHVYASSYLKARPGSTHGYDITDHAALNPELGTEEDFSAMCAAFGANGLGQILDLVPNHMGVGGSDNAFWLDVLEWGPHSEHAGWFDIDWDPSRRYLHEKLLVPFLGDQYGVELEAGNLKLIFDAEAGTLAVWAYETHKLPVCPLHYDRILGHDDAGLEKLGDAFSDLPSWRPQVAARAVVLKGMLAALIRENDASRASLDAVLARINASAAELGAIIEEQFWRVASFHVAGDDINYRRFFNINDLAGIRMELPVVFEAAHARVRRMLEDGTLDGIRIDHIDGLLDPKEYLERLRACSERPFYLVVEKILARHEQLRPEWPVEGTTGYDFTNQVLGVLVDPSGEEAFTRFYQSFTNDQTPFRRIVHACKLRIMDNEMASELNVLGRDAGRVAQQNPKTADFTRNLLQRAIREVVAAFPVYRTYIDRDGKPSDTDRRDLDWAFTTARRAARDLPPSVFDFLYGLLSTDIVSEPHSGFSRHSVMRLAMKLQQYSGPVMAKGLEDTAFYRYNRFVALNEVGGEPEVFGISAAAFHRSNAQRAKTLPHAMLGTSTHDTKRGEDTRARLAVLSSMGEEWPRQVAGWSRMLRARRGDVEGTAPPDRNDEYLLYQLLIGSWPTEMLDPASVDADALGIYAERIRGALEKSMREAKLHSSWSAPDTAYEDAMQGFAADALDPQRATFLNAFLPFAERVARLGVDNSLAQLVLKLTVPGMPDIYQGSEMWDLSLVDPDNRRPVDYDRCRRILVEIEQELGEARRELVRRLYANWKDGAIKLAVTTILLDLRKHQPQLFADGGYEAIEIGGTHSEHAIGFARRCHGETLVVLVARFPAARDGVAWDATAIGLTDGRLTDVLTGTVHDVERGTLPLARAFADLPAAVLTSSSLR